MFTYTFSRKKLLRTAVIVLAVLVGAGIIVMAVMSSFKVSAADKKLPVYGVERTDNKIAVTFDCAWGNSNTDLLLSLLKDVNAKATFFVTGEFCDKYPEDVKKMFDAGHEIGNHSNAHPHVEGININDLIEDTRECTKKIKMITGEEPKLYRAPYGEYDDNVITTIEGMGFNVIQWSVDSIDWQEPEPDTIIKRIVEGTKSGSILLFHNDLENTAKALPQLLTMLKQKGFTFSKVSDILYSENYHIDSSGIQIYDAAALIPTAKYSDNYLINEAMEIFRQNLTMQEIYNLSGGATPQLLEKTAPLLSPAQLAAIQEASFEELKEAVTNLIRAAEEEGAGGDNSDNANAVTTPEASGSTPPVTPETTGEDYYEPPVSTSTQSQSAAPAETAPEITAAASIPGNPYVPINPSATGKGDIKGQPSAPITAAQTKLPQTADPEITTTVTEATTPEITTTPETTVTESTAGRINEIIK